MNTNYQGGSLVLGYSHKAAADVPHCLKRLRDEFVGVTVTEQRDERLESMDVLSASLPENTPRSSGESTEEEKQHSRVFHLKRHANTILHAARSETRTSRSLPDTRV